MLIKLDLVFVFDQDYRTLEIGILLNVVGTVLESVDLKAGKWFHFSLQRVVLRLIIL